MMQSASVEARVEAGVIDALFAGLNEGRCPGAAVGIAIAGEPVYRKGFGLATLEPPLAISPATRMRIASVTKHFTCLAYLLLCEDGRARIDDPIGRHLPELNAASRSATIAQLMAHTSGLRDACDWFYYDTRQRATGADILRFYRSVDDVNGAVDWTWCYNDGAYLLLGLAIERISDRPLEELFHERIFAPLGLRDTVLSRWDTQSVPNSADPYIPNADGRFEKALRFTEGLGQGGMLSSVDDMLRWLAHMDAPLIGTSDTWSRIRTPRHVANGASTGYGFGLISSRYHGVDTLWHSGMVLGGKSQMLKVPAAGLDIVVIANRHDVPAVELANEVLEACLPGVQEPQPRHMPPATGTFRSPTSDSVIQLSARGWQQIVSVNGADLLFSRSAEDARLLQPVSESAYRKQRVVLAGDPLSPHEIDFCDYGNSEKLVAETSAALPGATPIAGRYRSNFAGTEAVVSYGEGGPRLSTVGPFGSPAYQLECLTGRTWCARGTSVPALGGVLTFEADASGFRLTTNANQAVRFRRIGD